MLRNKPEYDKNVNANTSMSVLYHKKENVPHSIFETRKMIGILRSDITFSMERLKKSVKTALV